MQAFFLTFGLTIGYSVVHSLLAATQTKAVMRVLMGERAYEGLYRLVYNVLAVVLLLPIVWIILIDSGEVLWRVYFPLDVLFILIQLVGGLGALVSIAQIDGSRFLGLSQFERWAQGRQLPLPPEPLSTRGMYAFTRHPLYLFGLMVIWPVPEMTEAWFGFSVASTIYFVLGSLLEEQKLLAAFGVKYLVYQRKVPWFLPIGRRSSSTTSDQS